MSDKDVNGGFDKSFDFDRNGKLDSYEQMRQREFLDENHGNAGGFGGIFGTLVLGVILSVAGIVVLTLVLTMFNADIDNIPSGVLMFMFIVIVSLIASVVSVFKR